MFQIENSVEIVLHIENKQSLISVFKTISVEMTGIQTDRGKAEIYHDGISITLKITAVDFVALRALSNSTMRLIKTSMDIIDSID